MAPARCRTPECDTLSRALFKTIWEVDRDWMPEIRSLVEHEEMGGKRVFRLTSVEDLDGFLSRPDL